MKKILISPEQGFEEINALESLAHNGMDLFHLRKPDFSEEMISKFLQQCPPSVRTRTVLHSHFHLAKTYKLHGIHLKVNQYRKIFSQFESAFSFSSSLHKIIELYEIRPGLDYVFISPVFSSISKKNYGPAFSWNTLVKSLDQTTFKVVALGGINAGNIQKVIDAGFDGYAVKGCIWEKSDPLKAWKNLRRAENITSSYESSLHD